MKLEGIHHVTAITGDAQGNVDFYVDKLGLRLVKKTVNQDDPTVYHLLYADEKGAPAATSRSSSTPARPRGAPAPAWCTASCGGSARRTRSTSGPTGSVSRATETRRSSSPIPKGSSTRSSSTKAGRSRSPREHPEIPAEHALRGFAGVARSAATRNEATSSSRRSGSSPAGSLEATTGAGRYEYDQAPAGAGVPGAGTVHHVAWASQPEEHAAWRERAAAAGARADADHRALLLQVDLLPRAERRAFEIATIGPGFTADEPLESLGERLSLPPDFEGIREQVEPMLTPITTRARRGLVRRARTRQRASPQGRSSSSTAAGRTSTTSPRCSTCSTRSGGSVGITPRGPLSLPPGGAHWYAVGEIGYPDPATFHATFAAA